MANLKKEMQSILDRFDAAQKAFTSNSTDVKKLNKQNKKALKSVQADLKEAKAQNRDARIEIEALRAELAIAKLGAPTKSVKSSKPAGRRGRPAGVKNKTAAKATTAAKPAGKRGRPAGSKNKTAAKATPAVEATPTAKAPAAAKPTGKRGRPAGSKNKDAAAKAPTAAKPAGKRGRPAGAKNKTAAAAKASTGAKRSPGRPRTTPKVAASALEAVAGVGPAMAKHFEAAGVKTPAAMSKLSNAKMAEILAKCGPRYRNATPEKMKAYKEAATAAK